MNATSGNKSPFRQDGRRLEVEALEPGRALNEFSTIPAVTPTLPDEEEIAFELRKELPKILAEHAAYGRVLILHRTGEHQWSVVQFHADSGRADLGDAFRLADAASY